jgi:hypothetical protein
VIDILYFQSYVQLLRKEAMNLSDACSLSSMTERFITNAQMPMTLMASFGVQQKWMNMEIMTNLENIWVTVVKTVQQSPQNRMLNFQFHQMVCCGFLATSN